MHILPFHRVLVTIASHFLNFPPPKALHAMVVLNAHPSLSQSSCHDCKSFSKLPPPQSPACNGGPQCKSFPCIEFFSLGPVPILRHARHTLPIDFLFLKLPPPPCAVLLEYTSQYWDTLDSCMINHSDCISESIHIGDQFAFSDQSDELHPECSFFHNAVCFFLRSRHWEFPHQCYF